MEPPKTGNIALIYCNLSDAGPPLTFCGALHHDLRLIGFEELGNSDGFETAALELRLQMSGEFVSSYIANPNM